MKQSKVSPFRSIPWKIQPERMLTVETHPAILQAPSPVEGSPLCDFPSPHALWNNMTNLTTPTNSKQQQFPSPRGPLKILATSILSSPDENSIFSNVPSASPGSPIPLTRRSAFSPLSLENVPSLSPAQHDRTQVYMW